MKNAWIENGIIRDVCQGNPAELFYPDIAALYNVEVPDDAVNGDGWDGVTLTKPVIPVPVAQDPVAPIPPKVSPIEFKLLFTPQERVAIKAARATDAILDDFYSIVEDPRLNFVDLGLQSTKDAIGYLETKGLLTADRAAVVLTGVLI